MKRVRKEEKDLIRKVIPNIESKSVIGGGAVLIRCAEKSNWYLVDDNTFDTYLKRAKYYIKMWDLKGNRIDGKGKIISKKEVYYLDKSIAENKEKCNRK